MLAESVQQELGLLCEACTAGTEDPGSRPDCTTTHAGLRQLVSLPSGASLKYSAAARNLSGYESVQELECCSIREEKLSTSQASPRTGSAGPKCSDHQEQQTCCLPMTSVNSQAVGSASARGLASLWCVPRGYGTILGQYNLFNSGKTPGIHHCTALVPQ